MFLVSWLSSSAGGAVPLILCAIFTSSCGALRSCAVLVPNQAASFFNFCLFVKCRWGLYLAASTTVMLIRQCGCASFSLRWLPSWVLSSLEILPSSQEIAGVSELWADSSLSLLCFHLCPLQPGRHMNGKYSQSFHLSASAASGVSSCIPPQSSDLPLLHSLPAPGDTPPHRRCSFELLLWTHL